MYLKSILEIPSNMTGFVKSAWKLHGNSEHFFLNDGLAICNSPWSEIDVPQAASESIKVRPNLSSHHVVQ